LTYFARLFIKKSCKLLIYQAKVRAGGKAISKPFASIGFSHFVLERVRGGIIVG
jgi:hypothetical protein